MVGLHVVAAGASERQPDGSSAATYETFEQLLATAGLSDLPILLPPFFYGVSYWGHMVYIGPKETQLLDAIQSIVWPGGSLDYSAYCADLGRDPTWPPKTTWTNRVCDILTLWCHVQASDAAFVTRDQASIGRHAARLAEVGVGEILSPAAAASRYGPPDE